MRVPRSHASRRWLQILLFSVLLAACLASIPGDSPLKDVSANSTSLPAPGDHLLETFSKKTCHDVHQAEDKCAFVQKYCSEDISGLIPYLDIYYCNLHAVKPIYWTLLVVWMIFLFIAIGACASEFLTTNLGTLGVNLGMSESLAGVTLLAFGNGSPDLASTFMSMSHHSGSLAIGELIGAAGFITTVVAAAAVLPGRFRVKRYAFLRDILFFATAVTFTIYFLIDGHLALWECIVMVLFYVLYVCTVFSWSMIITRIKKRNAKLKRARGHFVTERALEGARQSSPVAMGELDDNEINDNPPRSLLVEEDQEALLEEALKDPEEEDEENTESRDRMLADMAEISNQMRVTHRHRRTLSRITNTNLPIRPSLLGALEFGSVIQSIERARTRRTSQSPHGRRYSSDVLQRSVGRSQSGNDADTLSANQLSRVQSHQVSGASSVRRLAAGETRIRSVSANATDIYANLPANAAANAAAVHADQPAMLAAPRSTGVGQTPARKKNGLQLSIPAINVSDETGQQSAAAVDDDTPIAFPRYTDDPDGALIASPGAFSPVEGQNSWPLPVIGRRRAKIYAIWHKTQDILWPQLKSWAGKSRPDKVMSVIAIPIIFAFTLTIPTGLIIKEEKEDKPRPQTRPSLNRTPSEGLESTNKDGLAHPGSRLSSATASPLLSPVSEQATVLESTAPIVAITEEPEQIWDPYLMSAQIMIAPIFFFFAVSMGWLGFDLTSNELIIWCSSILGSSVLTLILFWCTNVPNEIPTWQNWLSVPGFAVAVGWISMIAGEVVGILQTFQLVTGFSEAILGLLIFAAGNSVSDLFANYNTAKVGRAEMAFHACFGGPLMNILLGIGLGGMYHTIKKGQKHNHGGSAPLNTLFHIEVGRTLVVSGFGLLGGLIGLAVLLYRNKWVMNRRIGWMLSGWWLFITIANVILELLQMAGVIKPW